MKTVSWLAAFCGIGMVLAYATFGSAHKGSPTGGGRPAHFAVTKTDAEWRKTLTPAQYYILRQQGTEAPGTGKYNDFYKPGTYVCAACGNKLFSSDTKYDAKEGWPSFWTPISKASVLEVSDNSLGMDRTEVICARCGGHLGHVFTDGPKPTGLRYCIDSDALKFIPKK